MIHMHMTNIMLMLKTMINHFFVQSLSQQNPRWRMPLRRFPTPRSELELGIYRDTWCQHVEHWCFCRCSGLLQLQLTCFCMFCFGHVLPTSPCCMFFANVWGCSWGYCDNSHGDLHHKAPSQSTCDMLRSKPCNGGHIPTYLYGKLHRQVQACSSLQ